MTSTITAGAELITPLTVTDYQSTREGGNIVHRVIGRATPDITFRPALLRSGTLELAFDDANDSLTAEAALAVAEVCTLVDPDVPTTEMSFIVAGRIDRSITNEDHRKIWYVTVEYQEVGP